MGRLVSSRTEHPRKETRAAANLTRRPRLRSGPLHLDSIWTLLVEFLSFDVQSRLLLSLSKNQRYLAALVCPMTAIHR